MSLKDFEVVKQLGKGAFGSVHLVKRKEDGNIYALKMVQLSKLPKKEQENSLNEVRVLASVVHPNIIGYKEAFFDEDSRTLNIVMEFADDGDLETKIQKHIKNKTNFPENDVWSYLIQMVQGLKALHEIRIMHRDLKSANVFLMTNGILKLGDLNVSKVVKLGMVYTQTGTPYYASPEVWADKPYGYKSDLWSIGCVLYELCTLKPPFRGANLEELYNNVTRGKYEPIPSIYSSDLAKIVALLLQTNPTNRPSCDQLLSNPIILKRMDYNKNGDCGGTSNLLGTIKFRNINEINQKLPKTKNYVDHSGLSMYKAKNDINFCMPVVDEELAEKETNPALCQQRPSKNSIHRDYESARKDNVNGISRLQSGKLEPRSKTPGVMIRREKDFEKENALEKTPIIKKDPVINNNKVNNIYQPRISPSNNMNLLNIDSQRREVPSNLIKPTRSASARPTQSRLDSQRKELCMNSHNNNNYNYINSKPSYDDKSPSSMNREKLINNIPMNRPMSRVEKIERKPVVQAQQPSNLVTAKKRIVAENPEHKLLINPIKIIENPSSKRILSSRLPNNGSNDINLMPPNISVNPIQNNFLKGGGINANLNMNVNNNKYINYNPMHNVGIKIVQNSGPKLLNLYRK